MRHRGAMYVGILLLLLGAFFLLLNVGGAWTEKLSFAHLWPVLIIWVGLAFFLPIFIWWDKRMENYGLAMPGSIVAINGLILLYCSLTGNWDHWTYLWALEPFSVAIGLLIMWLLGPRAAGLLIAALLIGVVSLGLFVIFASLMGSPAAGIAGAGTLIVLGALLVAGALIRPAASDK